MQMVIDLSTLQAASEQARQTTKKPWENISVAVKHADPTELPLDYVCLLNLYYTAAMRPVRRSPRLCGHVLR
jgi:hypothetical protein